MRGQRSYQPGTAHANPDITAAGDEPGKAELTRRKGAGSQLSLPPWPRLSCTHLSTPLTLPTHPAPLSAAARAAAPAAAPGSTAAAHFGRARP
eukprot:355192-Chlamydomonas_euryale.AAC.7